MTRRRSRRFVGMTVPVVDAGDLNHPNEGSIEVGVLARQEAHFSARNDVADFVSARIVSEEKLSSNLRGRLRSALITAAIERFHLRLSQGAISNLVDASILQEVCRREETARYRAAVARQKANSEKGAVRGIVAAGQPAN